MSQQPYALTAASSFGSSSSFNGTQSSSVTANAGETYLLNGFFKPNTSIPSGLNAQARFPRFGEQCASPIYAPPVMVPVPLGTLVPVTNNTSTKSIFSRGHATTTSGSGLITQNVLDFFNSVINNQVSPLNAGLATAALNFLNTVKQGTATTWGPAAGNIAQGSFVYDDNTTLGTAVAGPAGTAVLGGASGAGGTYIFCNGNFSVASISAVGVATDYVVVLCTGAISFSNLHAGATLRNVLLLSCGSAPGVATGSSALASTDIVACAYPGQLNNHGTISNVTASTAGGFIFFNGTTTVTNASYDPHNLGTLMPAVQSFTQYAFADLHTYDQVADTPEPTLGYASFTGFSGSTNFYGLTASTALLVSGSLSDILNNLAARICVQFGVVPGSASNPGVLGDNISSQAGCNYLYSTFFNVNYTTAIAFQTASGQTPNLGVSTEYHNFNGYVVPDAVSTTAVWLQTYRAADQVYAPIKNANGGRYFTLNAGGQIVIGTTDFTYPTTPYYVETTLIPADCTLSLSTTFPVSDTVTAASGGADPYTTITDNGTADVVASSTYRTVSAPATAPVGATKVTLVVPNVSYVDYSPYNGDVTSDGNVNGKVRIFNNSRQANIVTATVTCQPSAVTGDTFDPFFNGSDIIPTYPIPGAGEFVTYKDATKVRFSIASSVSGASENYTINAGASVLIGSYLYTYTVSGSTGTLSKISGGVSTTVGTYALGSITPTPAPVTVFLTIIFGDTIMNNTNYNVNSITDGSVPATYFVRTVSSVEAYGDVIQAVSTPGSPYYFPNLTQATITQLSQAGVNPVAGQPGYYEVTVLNREPLFCDTEVVIYGTRISYYNPNQTQVAVQLADGTYTNRAGDTVTVLNGLANVADLPIDIGYVSFIAQQAPAGSSSGLTSQTYTVGVGKDYANFGAADTALGLSELLRLSYTGNLTVTSNPDGTRKDNFSGAGQIVYQTGTGGTITIIAS
jgi:hypothetical protein